MQTCMDTEDNDRSLFSTPEYIVFLFSSGLD